MGAHQAPATWIAVHLPGQSLFYGLQAGGLILSLFCWCQLVDWRSVSIPKVLWNVDKKIDVCKVDGQSCDLQNLMYLFESFI